jgi:hypothetical protein
MNVPRPKKGDRVLMWKGDLTGSPYPVPDAELDDPDKWVEAEVVDVPNFRSPQKQSHYLMPVDGDYAPKWVPPSGWKELP